MDDVVTGESAVERSSGVGGIALVTVTLIAVGLVMVTSATLPIDRAVEGADIWRSVYGRQAIFALAGLLVFPLCMGIAGRVLASMWWRRHLPVVLFVVAVVAMLATFVPWLVDTQHGSQRWLRLGAIGVGVQPSELAKLALVGVLAHLLTERGLDLRHLWRGFVPAAAVVGLTVLLVGKEDFGTAALIGLVGMAMLLVGGAAIRHLAILSVLGAAAFGVLLLSARYRVDRLVAFWDIWGNAQGDGYQPVQSLTAIASGGWFGTGLGAGIQKYGYLPEAHSDFVFSIICEETGLVGGAVVIALFCGFVWLGLRTMRMARSSFERLLAFGITATIGLQAVMNIAVATVVAPTTGISLPFISAGGSGLIALCMAVGVLAAVAARAASAQSLECFDVEADAIHFTPARLEERGVC